MKHGRAPFDCARELKIRWMAEFIVCDLPLKKRGRGAVQADLQKLVSDNFAAFVALRFLHSPVNSARGLSIRAESNKADQITQCVVIDGHRGHTVPRCGLPCAVAHVDANDAVRRAPRHCERDLSNVVCRWLPILAEIEKTHNSSGRAALEFVSVNTFSVCRRLALAVEETHLHVMAVRVALDFHLRSAAGAGFRESPEIGEAGRDNRGSVR